MNKTIFAYLCMGLAISFTIIYIFIDHFDENIPLTEVESTANIVVEKSKNRENLVSHDKPIIEKVVTESPEIFKPSFKINNIDDALFQFMEGVSFHHRGYIRVEDLKLLEVTYIDFSGESQVGQMIVHKLVAEEVVDIFKILYEKAYPIDKIRLVYNYQGNDDLSMADNNTHSFNDRMIGKSKKMSNHAFGLAIDINPIQNPYVKGSVILPPEGKDYLNRETYQQGMVLKDDVCYHAFTDRGWTWGGDWDSLKDYQHFEKKIPNIND